MNEQNTGSDSAADYTVQTWRVAPGAARTIDVTEVRALHVGLMAGQISVVGHDGDDTRIEIDEVADENVDITLDDGTLAINQPKMQFSRAFDSLRSMFGSSTSANVQVLVPNNTRVKIGTKSAEVLVSDTTAGAVVNSASGEVQLSGVSGRIDVNTASGRIDVYDLDGRLEVRTVSGEITVMGRSSDIGVDTVSADVLLDLRGEVASVNTNSVSGNVTARFDGETGVHAKLRSMSGWMRVLDSPAVKGGQEVRIDGTSTVRITSSSVSGNLTVMHR